jgi:hypothetical protein
MAGRESRWSNHGQIVRQSVHMNGNDLRDTIGFLVIRKPVQCQQDHSSYVEPLTKALNDTAEDVSSARNRVLARIAFVVRRPLSKLRSGYALPALQAQCILKLIHAPFPRVMCALCR